MKRRFLLTAAPVLAVPVAAPAAPVIEAHANDFTISEAAPVTNNVAWTRAPDAAYVSGAHVIMGGAWWIAIEGGVTSSLRTFPTHVADIILDGSVIWHRYA